MPMTFSVSNYDTPEMVGTDLINAGRSVNSLRTVMNNIFIDMLVGNEANIRSEGRRGGGSYKQLTTFTLIKKGSAEILYTVGSRPGYTKIGGDALVNSVTQPDAEFQIKRVTDTEVALGTSRPHARVHQYGHSGKPNIPARPFLQMTQYDVDRWKGWITTHLMAGLVTSKQAPKGKLR